MKFKVQVAGAEHEVEIAAIPEKDVAEKYVPLGEHEATVRSTGARVRKEFDGYVKPDALIEDDTFVDTLLSKRGDAIAAKLKIQRAPDGAAMELLQKQAEERVGKPLTEQLTAREREIAELRVEKLRGEVGRSCRALDVADDAPELIELYYERRTRWDPEHKGFFIVDPANPDGFEPTEHPKRGKAPWKTIEEHLAEIRKSDSKKGWFKAGSSGKAVELGRPGEGKGAPLAEQIAAAEAAGKWADAARLKREMLEQATDRASSR